MTTLIPGGAAFLGALIGFVGLLLTNKRTVLTTREQRRYELVRDKRGETIPEMYYRSRKLLTEFTALLNVPIQMQDERGKPSQEVIEKNTKARNDKGSQFIKQLNDLDEYYERNAIWLPTELGNLINNFLIDFTTHARKYLVSITESISEFESSIERDRIREDISRKSREVEASLEANSLELKSIAAEYGISLGETQEATRRQMEEESKRMEAILADLTAGIADTDVDNFSYLRALDESQKGDFRLWLIFSGNRQLDNIYKESRKVLGVDD